MEEKFDFEKAILTIDGSAATVQFNRLHKKNAMSPEVHESMNAAFDEIGKRDDIKAIVITGAEDSFCGGMDLEKFFMPCMADVKTFKKVYNGSYKWWIAIKESPAVTICSINGYCFGAAIALVGLCDLAIAADEAKFGLSEVNFGMFPGGGTSWAVSRNFNLKQGLWYSLTGEPFSGKEAAELGLVNRSVPKEKLAEETDKLVQNIVKKNGLTLEYVKKVYEAASKMSWYEAVDYENAKLHELTFLQGSGGWINNGLQQFKKREFKPGLGAYKIGAGE
jgi:trans-feruloyl-CoA hydratase/vanillin synthase